MIGKKAKHFDLVQKCSYRKQIVSVWPKNSGTKQSNLIWSGNCLGQNRMFLYNPKTYRSKAKHFDLVHLLSERKQNVLIWSAYCRNKSKTI
jgi:hypothetical protein